jgi:hypothetical protein
MATNQDSNTTVKPVNQQETLGNDTSAELEGIKKMFTDGENGIPVTAKVTMNLNGGTLESPENITVDSIQYPAGTNGGGTRGGKKRRKKRRSTKKKRKQKQKKRAK